MAFRPPECANEQMPRLLDAKNAAAACIARRPGFAVVAGVCRVNFPTTDRIFVAKGGRSSACDLACLGLKRLHVATFDAAGGGDYNRQNCGIAQELFQQQPGVKVRYWCEKGRFHG